MVEEEEGRGVEIEVEVEVEGRGGVEEGGEWKWKAGSGRQGVEEEGSGMDEEDSGVRKKIKDGEDIGREWKRKQFDIFGLCSFGIKQAGLLAPVGYTYLCICCMFIDNLWSCWQ